ncbi:hypothetical protein Pint_34171 [Pistacia integerrima]|uniref:Uncharacterized protein n=1 Tax=Pistacia integerrima TaxID=434235 RepID=A0ACC0X7U6_9ROSI|nr:hypothetical protein Pint_34171 [Pistacia integerrima]
MGPAFCAGIGCSIGVSFGLVGGLCLMVLKIPDDLPITMMLVLKDKAVSKTGRH